MSNQATADSAFFTALPLEVRISILTAAIGGRTLHIQECSASMRESWRKTTAVKPKGSRGALGIARQRLGGLFRVKTKDKAQTEAVQPAGRQPKWCGRVCCRGSDKSPAEDTCLGHFQPSCLGNVLPRLREGGCSCGSPPERAVGAIGWLLTCRRAYDEGILILYNSNTFHVRTSSMHLLGHLVMQIPANILSCITSVECYMEDRFICEEDYNSLPATDRSKSEADMLKRTLSSVPRLMPSLKQFYIGFDRDTCLLPRCEYRRSLVYPCTKHLASLLGDMAVEFDQMGRSCDLELGIPSMSFDSYPFPTRKKDRKSGHPHWRPDLPSTCSYFPRYRVFRPVCGRGPESELGTDDGGVSDFGYWMSRSVDDYCKLGAHLN